MRKSSRYPDTAVISFLFVFIPFVGIPVIDMISYFSTVLYICI